MADAVTIVPGQWPPLGATKTMLSRFESGLLPATPLEPTTAQAEDTPMAEEMESPPMRERPLQGLSAQQLRQEIARLERHILDLPQDGYGPLRDALEDNLAQTRAELLARKPEGQALDQAVAKHKHAQRALQLATQNRDQARESLRLAEAAFQQTKLTEEAAAQEVQKQRSAISDYEALAPPLRSVPSEKLVGLYQILQQAGVQDRHLQEVATLFGTSLPPQPPPPTVPHPQGTTEEGLPAQPAPPDRTETPHLAPAFQGLAHPSNLASQLLASAPMPKPPPPKVERREGRSPVAKRRLPPRGGQGDYASTYRSNSPPSRSASRSLDRGHQDPLPPGTENRRSAALSPTQPHPGAQEMPSSLVGVAPAN